MKGDCDDYVARNEKRKFKRDDYPHGKINTLLADLLEKEEEITFYKDRLKELEAAFYYNLELISERDLELKALEKQLADENKQLKKVIRERNELEDLIKIIHEKNNRKIHQLETRLTLKEEEITDLQRESMSNINTLKRIIQDVKQQQQKRICKISTKFEMQKNELIKGYREEIEEKEKYYLLEIDNLAGKLEQACREKNKLARAEEEIRDLKSHLEDLEKVFLEKENHYLEEIKKISKSYLRKVNKEVQCGFHPQLIEKIIQAEPDISVADSQTIRVAPEEEEQHYKQRISFLQEQNEVLKFIIKDLKRNREAECRGEGVGQPPGCECFTLREDIEQVNKKFESEINNLKKILEKEQKERAEEEAVIQSLETSMTCLKDKLLLDLQEKLQQLSGDDICRYVCNREIQNEFKVSLLEQKLCQKMDSLMRIADEERQKIHEKLEEVKKECAEKIENYLKSKEEPMVLKSENLLEKIRLEIQKLENKIENDMRNIVRNNGETNKCYKNVQSKVDELGGSGDSRGNYYRNDLSPEEHGQEAQFKSQTTRKKLGGQTELWKFTNNLVAGR